VIIKIYCLLPSDFWRLKNHFQFFIKRKEPRDISEVCTVRAMAVSLRGSVVQIRLLFNCDTFRGKTVNVKIYDVPELHERIEW